MESFIEPMGLSDYCSLYSTMTEAFGAVESGACDVVAVPYNTGIEIIENNDYRDIHECSVVLYSSTLCIGVAYEKKSCAMR